jgi:apolipoprotein N-acyltransferase
MTSRREDDGIAIGRSRRWRMYRDVTWERHRGVVWMVAGTAFLALMFGFWWLVESTNKEGHHDAQLLPILALIPLGIGAYHLVRGRQHRTQ